MATYIVIFLFELIPAYVLWFVLKKILNTTKFYRIIIICCVISLVSGYIASYRMIGYEVTMDYLTNINEQEINETGHGITLQEENQYKKELFNDDNYQKFLITSSIKLSLTPFILIIFLMLFSAKKAKDKKLKRTK